MKEVQKRVLAESAKTPSKKRRIDQFKESNIAKVSRVLETYLLPSFTLVEWDEGVEYFEICGIRYPDYNVECQRAMSNDSLELLFEISGPKGVFNVDVMRIDIGREGISLYRSREHEILSVDYSIQGKTVTILSVEGRRTATNKNLKQVIESFDSRLPSPASHLVNYFPIKETERLIVNYRNRTEDVLRIFWPSLPHEIFSIIWDFAISEGVLSSKFTCGIARLLDYVLEDSEEHWLKSVSLAVSKLVEQFQGSEASYLLEKCSMKSVDFKPLSQFAKEIYLLDK